MDKKDKEQLEKDLLKITQSKYKSAQEKYIAIQKLAKKYNMPVSRLLKNIILEWLNEDKEKRFKK